MPIVQSSDDISVMMTEQETRRTAELLTKYEATLMENDSIIGRIEKAREARVRLEATLAQCVKDERVLTAEISGKSLVLDALRSRRDQLAAESKTCDRQVQEASRRIERLKAALAKQNEEKESQHAKKEEVAAALEGANAELQRLRADLDERTKEVQIDIDRLEIVTTTLNDLSDKLDCVRASEARTRKELREREDAVDIMRLRATSLADEVAKLQPEISALEAQAASLKDRRLALQKRVDKHQSDTRAKLMAQLSRSDHAMQQISALQHQLLCVNYVISQSQEALAHCSEVVQKERDGLKKTMV